MGGGGGSALGAIGQLSETGLDTSQLGSLMGMFKDHVGEAAGSDVAEQALGSIPGLDQLFG